MYEGDLRFLLNRWDDLWNCRPVSSGSLDRLGARFTHATAIRNLTDLFDALERRLPTFIAPDITYADVRDRIRNGQELPVGAMTDDAAKNWVAGFWPNDPWRVIDRWLATEGLLLSAGAPAPTRAAAIAREVFDSILGPAGLPRSAQVAAAYEARWSLSAQRLADWISGEYVRRNPWTRESLGRSLADSLADEAPRMNGKVRHKHIQFDGSVRNRFVLPVTRLWIARFSSRLLAAVRAGVSFELSDEDVGHLRTLLTWLVAQGAIPAPGPPAVGPLWAAVRRPEPFLIPEPYVPAFLAEWNGVIAPLRLGRQIPSIPAAGLFVGDVVRCAMSAAGPRAAAGVGRYFRNWFREVAACGLQPSPDPGRNA